MTLDKRQRLRLTFDLSAEVTRIGFPSIYLSIFSQKPSGKFHIKTSSGRGTSIYENGLCHMTKMATMLIYGKPPLRYSSPEPEVQ